MKQFTSIHLHTYLIMIEKIQKWGWPQAGWKQQYFVRDGARFCETLENSNFLDDPKSK